MTLLTRRQITTLALALGLALAAWTLPQAASAFSLEKGIVGNLPAQCRELGNCNWCDFVGLMVILQQVILSLFGGLALIMLIWGGQGIITAAGNQEHVKKAKGLITSTLLGVAIVLAGYFLINIVVGILITPRTEHKLETKLFGSNWWHAQCAVTDREAADFCLQQSDGTQCGNGNDMVCLNNQCVGLNNAGCANKANHTICAQSVQNGTALAGVCLNNTCQLTCQSAQTLDTNGTYSCQVACVAPEAPTSFYCSDSAQPVCCKS